MNCPIYPHKAVLYGSHQIESEKLLHTSRSKTLPRSHSNINCWPLLEPCGRTTQKGSGVKVVIRIWRSTQKPSVGVWHGPYLSHEMRTKCKEKGHFEQQIVTVRKTWKTYLSQFKPTYGWCEDNNNYINASITTSLKLRYMTSMWNKFVELKWTSRKDQTFINHIEKVGQFIYVRDDTGVKVAIFALKKAGLKTCKCHTNFQIYFLSGINCQCLISIWLH